MDLYYPLACISLTDGLQFRDHSVIRFFKQHLPAGDQTLGDQTLEETVPGNFPYAFSANGNNLQQKNIKSH